MKIIIHVYKTTNKIKSAERIFCKIAKKSPSMCVYSTRTLIKRKIKSKTRQKRWRTVSAKVCAGLH